MRKISEIAREIYKVWKTPNCDAIPYLEEMLVLDEDFFPFRIKNIISCFLSNTRSWRGEDAKRIKRELITKLKEYQRKEADYKNSFPIKWR